MLASRSAQARLIDAYQSRANSDAEADVGPGVAAVEGAVGVDVAEGRGLRVGREPGPLDPPEQEVRAAATAATVAIRKPSTNAA